MAAFGGVVRTLSKTASGFRERNVINAEVTGVWAKVWANSYVKAYTAENARNFIARGAPVFSQRRQNVDGRFGGSSFSSIVIGAIAVVMIVIGGNPFSRAR